MQLVDNGKRIVFLQLHRAYYINIEGRQNRELLPDE